jgi:hypothetical protein
MGPEEMKTTIELPDDLYRRAKAEAALRGRKLKDMVEEGLRHVLQAERRSAAKRREPTLAELMGEFRGIVDSGIGDLSSNPKHMAGYGRSVRNR